MINNIDSIDQIFNFRLFASLDDGQLLSTTMSNSLNSALSLSHEIKIFF